MRSSRSVKTIKIKNGKQLTQKLKAQIDHFSEQIVNLQKENIDINSENQVLAQRYSQLTQFNQALGDDLANFDRDIEFLEEQITEKNVKIERLSEEAGKLLYELEKYREILKNGGVPSQKLKKFEEKRKQIIQSLQKLSFEKLDIDSYDVLKARNEIMLRIQDLEDHNKELETQIFLLNTILDESLSEKEKEQILLNAMKQKKVDIKQLTNDIRQMQLNKISENNSNANLSEPNEKSNEADSSSIHSSRLSKKGDESSQPQSSRSNASSKSNNPKANLKLIKPFQVEKNKNESNSIVVKSSRSEKSDILKKHLPHLSDLNLSQAFGKSELIRKKHTKSENGPDIADSENIQSIDVSLSQKLQPESHSERSDQLVARPRRRRRKSKSSKDAIDHQIKIDAEAQASDSSSDLSDDDIDRLEKTNKKMVKDLKKQIKERKAQKQEIETELSKLNGELTLSKKLSFTIFADPLYHITNSLWLRSVPNQTDITGETIDFHLKILSDQENDKKASEIMQVEIKELQEQIKEKQKEIDVSKAESERREKAIEKVRNELDDMQRRQKGEQENQDVEMRMKIEILTDIKRLKQELKTKQELLQSTAEENQKVYQQLEELTHKKNELEHDIEELAFKEKPQIEELNDKVSSFQHRVEDSKNRLEKAKVELENKRAALESLKNSEEHQTYKKLFLKKKSVERRIMKWKILLKDPSETLQNLEQFSADNAEKRKNLKNLVEKYESIRFDKEQELLDTEQYLLLLESLLAEQKNNWS